MTRERRAYICTNKAHEVPPRRFVGPGDDVPECPDGHGKMQRQANVPYEKPNPDAPLGKPKRVKQRKRKD